MSMGNSTFKKSGGSQATSFTPNPDGHQLRLVPADACTRADSVYSTASRSALVQRHSAHTEFCRRVRRWQPRRLPSWSSCLPRRRWRLCWRRWSPGMWGISLSGASAAPTQKWTMCLQMGHFKEDKWTLCAKTVHSVKVDAVRVQCPLLCRAIMDAVRAECPICKSEHCAVTPSTTSRVRVDALHTQRPLRESENFARTLSTLL